MQTGDTFLFTNRDADQHLWFIISDTSQDPDRVLCISLTTFNSGKDPSCKLYPGDHPFIKHDSCISFRHSELTESDRINAGLESGVLVAHQRASAELIAKILDSASKSPFLKIEHREFLKEQGLIE